MSIPTRQFGIIGSMAIASSASTRSRSARPALPKSGCGRIGRTAPNGKHRTCQPLSSVGTGNFMPPTYRANTSMTRDIVARIPIFGRSASPLAIVMWSHQPMSIFSSAGDRPIISRWSISAQSRALIAISWTTTPTATRHYFRSRTGASNWPMHAATDSPAR